MSFLSGHLSGTVLRCLACQKPLEGGAGTSMALERRTGLCRDGALAGLQGGRTDARFRRLDASLRRAAANRILRHGDDMVVVRHERRHFRQAPERRPRTLKGVQHDLKQAARRFGH